MVMTTTTQGSEGFAHMTGRAVEAFSMGGAAARWAEERPGGCPAFLFSQLELLLSALLEPVFERFQLLPQRGHFLAEGLGILGRLAFLFCLGVRGRRGHPSRAHRPIAKDAIGLALTRHDSLEARLERFLHEVLPGLPVLDELVEKGGGKARAMAPLVLENDLRESDRGQVFSRGDIHHGNLLAGADQLLELLERDVAALLSIVELSVRVPLDDIRHT